MKSFLRFFIVSIVCVAVSLASTGCEPLDVIEGQEIYSVESEIGDVDVSYLIYKHERQVTSPLLLHTRSEGIGLRRTGSRYFFIDGNRKRHALKQKSIVWYDVEKKRLLVLADEWNYPLRFDKNEFSDYIKAVLIEAGIILE